MKFRCVYIYLFIKYADIYVFPILCGEHACIKANVLLV